MHLPVFGMTCAVTLARSHDLELLALTTLFTSSIIVVVIKQSIHFHRLLPGSVNSPEEFKLVTLRKTD